MNPCCDNPGRLRSGEDRWKENPGNPDCEGNELVRSGTMSYSLMSSMHHEEHPISPSTVKQGKQ